MDISLLVSFISPFLPYFLKLAGQKSAEKAIDLATKGFSEAAVHKAQSIWKKLRPKADSHKRLAEALADLASNPDDQDMQAQLRVQLKKLLSNDEVLTREIANILNEDAPDGTPGLQIIQNVTGDRNQIIGNISGGTTTYQN